MRRKWRIFGGGIQSKINKTYNTLLTRLWGFCVKIFLKTAVDKKISSDLIFLLANVKSQTEKNAYS
jgi:hypothetical protein